MAEKKILVVDDEVMLLETLRFRLEANDYDVITAENGKEGSFKAMSEKPDLILADIMMPEVTGIEMIKIIRANSDLKETPVIVLSALGRGEDVQNAMEAGANDYIVKPFETQELLDKIRSYLT
jgi:DNA-binding response OmpR family regulator